MFLKAVDVVAKLPLAVVGVAAWAAVIADAASAIASGTSAERVKGLRTIRFSFCYISGSSFAFVPVDRNDQGCCRSHKTGSFDASFLGPDVNRSVASAALMA
jgi:hypothetical protein